MIFTRNKITGAYLSEDSEFKIMKVHNKWNIYVLNDVDYPKEFQGMYTAWIRGQKTLKLAKQLAS